MEENGLQPKLVFELSSIYSSININQFVPIKACGDMQLIDASKACKTIQKFACKLAQNRNWHKKNAENLLLAESIGA